MRKFWHRACCFQHGMTHSGETLESSLDVAACALVSDGASVEAGPT
ncbi:MAG: hypothetical protein ABJQ34_14415 [Paracoccaceae bacterium]